MDRTRGLLVSKVHKQKRVARISRRGLTYHICMQFFDEPNAILLYDKE